MNVNIEVKVHQPSGYDVLIWTKDKVPKLLRTIFCNSKREANRLQKELAEQIKEEEKYIIISELHDCYMNFAIFDNDYDGEYEIAKGSIKWDNCSNWEVYETHFCELKDMQKFHKTLEKCYEIASKEMENWLTDEKVRSW